MFSIAEGVASEADWIWKNMDAVEAFKWMFIKAARIEKAQKDLEEKLKNGS